MLLETTLYVFMGFSGVLQPTTHQTPWKCEQAARQMIDAHKDYRKYTYVCINDEGHEIFKFRPFVKSEKEEQ